jgi:hypothetical protein
MRGTVGSTRGEFWFGNNPDSGGEAERFVRHLDL